MAKKKIEEECVSEAALKAVKKKYGDIIRTGSELFDKKSSLKCLSVSPAFDLALNGGIQEGSWTVVSGNPKCGKAQPLDCVVYTPLGKRTIGELKVGDLVSTPDGKTARIKYIHEQGIKDVYKITFNDNSSTECCIDHLWLVSKNNRKNIFKKMSLQNILDEGLRYSDRNKWKIPITKPVFFEEQEIDVDPYVLGCIIGDGSTLGGSINITNADEELLNNLSEKIKKNKVELINYDKKYSYGFTAIDKTLRKNELYRAIKKLNLVDKNSHNKFIPDVYKYNSINNRLELIRGLIDTDGHRTKYSIEYTTTSIRLANDVKELVESLGGTAKIKARYTSYNKKKTEFLSYRLYISHNNLDMFTKISRKKKNIKRSKPDLFRSIKKVEFVSNKECRCIELENDDHLYLTDNFIVTHNSTSTLQIIANGHKEGRLGIYVDSESRLKQSYLKGINGLDLEKINIISSEEQSLAAEDFLGIVDTLIRMPEYKGCVCVIDSTSSMLPRAEMDAEISGTLRANMPKLLSHWIKKNAQVVHNNKIIMILITHYITNTSGYGKVKVPDGGVMIQYQADNKIDFGKVEPWEEAGKKIGQKVECEISCSAMGASGTNLTTYIRYGHGIDFTREAMALGESFGLIEKAGAWFTLPFLEKIDKELSEKKFQGVNSVYEFISSNQNALDVLNQEILQLLST